MFNIEIREAIKRARVYSYEVANVLGMHETSFSRKISREECSKEEKQRILQAIEKVKEGNE
jgi:hypothetical protein